MENAEDLNDKKQKSADALNPGRGLYSKISYKVSVTTPYQRRFLQFIGKSFELLNFDMSAFSSI